MKREYNMKKNDNKEESTFGLILLMIAWIEIIAIIVGSIYIICNKIQDMEPGAIWLTFLGIGFLLMYLGGRQLNG